jgi:hypothetical protein
MRNAILAAVFSGASLLATSASADVQLTINNGQVTLSARDATIREILAEWARVGQTRIVNAERVASAPLTLELAGVSEEQALDVILRSVSGYLAAPRSVGLANASRYDRILVMPTSTGTRANTAPPPTFQQPQFTPPPVDEVDDSEDEDEEPAPPVPPNNPTRRPRGPVFNAPPDEDGAPRRGTPAQAPRTAPGVLSAPVMPAGVSVPGMVVPAPAPAEQPDAADTPEDSPQGD